MSIGVTKSGILQDSLALSYCDPSCGAVVSSFLEIVRVANRFLLEVLKMSRKIGSIVVAI
jgi:hypothetical protein